MKHTDKGIKKKKVKYFFIALLVMIFFTAANLGAFLAFPISLIESLQIYH